MQLFFCEVNQYIHYPTAKRMRGNYKVRPACIIQVENIRKNFRDYSNLCRLCTGVKCVHKDIV